MLFAERVSVLWQSLKPGYIQTSAVLIQREAQGIKRSSKLLKPIKKRGEFMENVVTVSFEVAKDSDLYKAAVKFSEKHNSVGIFSTPEKVLEYCTTFGISMHILRNMEFLGDTAEKQKSEKQ